MDSCKCQTSTATPAEPGELPWKLVPTQQAVADEENDHCFVDRLDQEKLAPAGPKVGPKLPADIASEVYRKRSQGFGRCGITIGKTILAAEEDSNRNQSQDFLIARLAVGKVSSKTVMILAGTLH